MQKMGLKFEPKSSHMKLLHPRKLQKFLLPKMAMVGWVHHANMYAYLGTNIHIGTHIELPKCMQSSS